MRWVVRVLRGHGCPSLQELQRKRRPPLPDCHPDPRRGSDHCCSNRKCTCDDQETRWFEEGRINWKVWGVAYDLKLVMFFYINKITNLLAADRLPPDSEVCPLRHVRTSLSSITSWKTEALCSSLSLWTSGSSTMSLKKGTEGKPADTDSNSVPLQAETEHQGCTWNTTCLPERFEGDHFKTRANTHASEASTYGFVFLILLYCNLKSLKFQQKKPKWFVPWTVAAESNIVINDLTALDPFVRMDLTKVLHLLQLFFFFFLFHLRVCLTVHCLKTFPHLLKDSFFLMVKVSFSSCLDRIWQHV